MSYEIIKSLHIISVISWMVGLLYLPRLFVYHADAPTGSVQAETFKVMERRLLKAIMTPAMIASFVFGLWMCALNPELFSEPWFHVKFAAVFLLAGSTTILYLLILFFLKCCFTLLKYFLFVLIIGES